MKQHNPGFLAVVNDAKSRVRQIDMEGYRGIVERGEAHLLIDVREDNEWQAGHAAGARHIGRGILERDIETEVPDKSACMVLYCGGGYRSALAADMLGKMGYENVISLDGGWRAWQESRMPTEKG